MAEELAEAIRQLANMAKAEQSEGAHEIAASALETLAKMDEARVKKETKDRRSAAIRRSLDEMWSSGQLGGPNSATK
ncbi:hypothetical protein [Mesorhizobium sp. ArgA1]